MERVQILSVGFAGVFREISVRFCIADAGQLSSVINMKVFFPIFIMSTEKELDFLLVP